MFKIAFKDFENLIKQGYSSLTAIRKKFLDSLSLGDLETELVEKTQHAAFFFERKADEVIKTMDDIKEEAVKRTKELFRV